MAAAIITRDMLLTELNLAKGHLERLESMLKLLNLPVGDGPIAVAAPVAAVAALVAEPAAEPEKKRGRPKGAPQSDGSKAWQAWVEYVVIKYADQYAAFMEKRKTETGEKRGNTKAMFAKHYTAEHKEEHDAFISEKKDQLSQTSKAGSVSGSDDESESEPVAAVAAAPVAAPVAVAAAPVVAPVAEALAAAPVAAPVKAKVKIVKKVPQAPATEPVAVPDPVPIAAPAAAPKPVKVKIVKAKQPAAAPAPAPAPTSDIVFTRFTHNGIQYLKDNQNYLYERDDTGAMGNFVGRFNAETNAIDNCQDPHA